MENVKQDDPLKRGGGEYGMKTMLLIWEEEKKQSHIFVLTLLKSIYVTSENKTNEAVEVVFVMLKIVAVFLDFLPHIT